MQFAKKGTVAGRLSATEGEILKDHDRPLDRIVGAFGKLNVPRNQIVVEAIEIVDRFIGIPNAIFHFCLAALAASSLDLSIAKTSSEL